MVTIAKGKWGAVCLACVSVAARAASPLTNEQELRAALDQAAAAAGPVVIELAEDAHITLGAPLVYTGTQPIVIEGHGAVLDGSQAGSFSLKADKTAETRDGTLVFNTAAPVTLRQLAVANSASRGIVVNVPDSARGEVQVTLEKVMIDGAALYGLHVDDNADAFDDGTRGSAAGILLMLKDVMVKGAGTGALDFDGVRVDERGEGSIRTVFERVKIEANGGDGIELDEAGPGSVTVTGSEMVLNGNGFYNAEDLDDGFDIDEADAGDMVVALDQVELNGNQDEGLDFDEAGDGDARVTLTAVRALETRDEAIKVDEEDAGDLVAQFRRIDVRRGGDDGIQLTEQGPGRVRGQLSALQAVGNKKYGIKVEQWVSEDEARTQEPRGVLKTEAIRLAGNGKGNRIKARHVSVN